MQLPKDSIGMVVHYDLPELDFASVEVLDGGGILRAPIANLNYPRVFGRASTISSELNHVLCTKPHFFLVDGRTFTVFRTFCYPIIHPQS